MITSSPRHLLGLKTLRKEDLATLLRPLPSLSDNPLKGYTIILVFLEPSTRTCLSFESAAGRLGAQTLRFDAKTSSLEKGESLSQTLCVLSQLADILIVRTPHALKPLATSISCHLINAGDALEHPTQGLLDALTLKKHFGSLKGKRLSICGDIVHSRVVPSTIAAVESEGMTITLIAPPPWLPPPKTFPRARYLSSLKDALKETDALMVLRPQRERHKQNTKISPFYITKETLNLLPPHGVLLHPGPIEGTLDMHPSLIHSPRSLILKQVQNGVIARMNALLWVAGP